MLKIAGDNSGLKISFVSLYIFRQSFVSSFFVTHYRSKRRTRYFRCVYKIGGSGWMTRNGR